MKEIIEAKTAEQAMSIVARRDKSRWATAATRLYPGCKDSRGNESWVIYSAGDIENPNNQQPLKRKDNDKAK